MEDTKVQEQSLTSQSISILFAKLVSFVLSVLLPLLVVRFMTPHEVGVYRQVFLVSNYLVDILPLGLSMSAYYFLNRENQKERSLSILNILIFNFILGGLACLSLVLYPGILISLFQNDEMISYAAPLGILIWLRIFGGFLEIVALANREAKTASVMIILMQMIYMALMVGAILVYNSVNSLIVAALIHSVIQTATLFLYINTRFPGFWKHFDLKFMRQQLTYALPFGLAALLYSSQTDVHNFFVGNKFSAADFAVYSIGCFQLPLIWVLYESVSAVVIPKMSELQANGEKRQMIALSVNAMLKLGLVYFPMFFFLMITAKDFIITLFTPTYVDSVPIFRINLILLPLMCIMVDPIGRAFAEVGSYLLKIRAVLFLLLSASLWLVIDDLNMFEVIGLVVMFIIVEKALTVWKCLKLLEVSRADIGLLKDTLVAFCTAGAAALPLLFIYLVLHDLLVEIYLKVGEYILSFLGISREVLLFEGLLLLGTMMVVYLIFYGLLLERTGLIDAEAKNKMLFRIRRLLQPKTVK
ncbi:MAG: oligosaccharide flippase family protein [Acidobacteria bacterium]|nr:oligosaccharide flippase family protein [Acidobacteriota bacterium]